MKGQHNESSGIQILVVRPVNREASYQVSGRSSTGGGRKRLGNRLHESGRQKLGSQKPSQQA